MGFIDRNSLDDRYLLFMGCLFMGCLYSCLITCFLTM
jgi:hypothetical protein